MGKGPTLDRTGALDGDGDRPVRGLRRPDDLDRGRRRREALLPLLGAHLHRAREHLRARARRLSRGAPLSARLGPIADESLDLELEAGVDRDAAERRLQVAELALREFATQVELELADPTSYAAGLDARRELVERRRRELDELGAATELELVRTTLRDEWPNLDSAERNRLLRVAVARLVIRKTPYFNAPAAERVRLVFAGEGSVSVAAAASSEDRAKLVENAA